MAGADHPTVEFGITLRVDKLGEGLKAASALFQEHTSSMAATASQRMGELSRALEQVNGYEELERRARASRQAWMDASKRLQDLGKEVREGGDAWQNYGQKADQAWKEVTGNRAEFQEAQRRLAEMRTSLQQIDVDWRNLARERERLTRERTAGRAMETLGVVSTRDAEAEIRRLQDAYQELKRTGVASKEELSRAGQALKNRIGEINRATQGGIDLFGRLGKAASTLGNVMGKIQSVANFVSLLKGPADELLQFNEAVNRYVLATGEGQKVVELVRRYAEEMVKTGWTSRTEVMELLRHLAGFGLDFKQQVEGVRTAFNLAIAAGIPLQEAGRQLTTIARDFELGFQSWDEIADRLTRGAQVAGVKPDDFITAFQGVSQAAREAGYGFEDAVEGMTIFSRQMGNASGGAETLKKVLAALGNPSREARAELQRLGAGVRRETGDLEDLATILERLAKFTLPQMETLFGREVGGEVWSLLQNGPELEKMIRDVNQLNRDAAGTAENVNSGVVKLGRETAGEIDYLKIMMGNSAASIAAIQEKTTKQIEASSWQQRKSQEEVNRKVQEGARIEVQKAELVTRLAREVTRVKVEEARKWVADAKQTLEFYVQEERRAAQEVESLQRQVRDKSGSLDDRRRELERRGMTEEEAEADRAAQAQERLARARELAKRAADALAAGDFDSAKEWGGQAREILEDVLRKAESLKNVNLGLSIFDDARRVFDSAAETMIGGAKGYQEAMGDAVAEARKGLGKFEEELKGLEEVQRRLAGQNLTIPLRVEDQGAVEEVVQKVAELRRQFQDALKLDTTDVATAVASLAPAIERYLKDSPLKMRISLERDELEEVRKILREEVVITPTVNTGPLAEEVKRLNQADSKELPPVKIPVGADTAPADEALARTGQQVKELTGGEKGWQVSVGVDTGNALAAIAGLREELRNIPDETVVVNVERREAHGVGGWAGVALPAYARGGSVTFPVPGPANWAGGGRLPGAPSTRDTIPALLAAGEYVVRASRAARFAPLLEAINSGSVAAIRQMLARFALTVPRFALGGPVLPAHLPAIPLPPRPAPTGAPGGGGGPAVQLELTLPGFSPHETPVRLFGEAGEVRRLDRLLRQANRGRG